MTTTPSGDKTDNIELAVGGITDCCGLCATALPEREAVGAFALNGVLCPDCAANIARYTPRCGYVGLSGDCRLGLYQYHTPCENASGVLFAEPSTVVAGTPEEVLTYYRNLPRHAQELIWYFGGNQWPDSYGLLDNLAIEAGQLQRALDPDCPDREDTPEAVTAAVSRLPRPFLAVGKDIAVPTNNRSVEAIREALPTGVRPAQPDTPHKSTTLTTFDSDGGDTEAEAPSSSHSSEQASLGAFNSSA